eukprot:COSAG02_NODE_197_length_29578_cov_9.718647_9_plen_289_part_00
MALLDLTVTTDESPTPTKKRPRYPSVAQDVASTDSAVAKAAAAAKASAAVARRQAGVEAAAVAKVAANAAKAQDGAAKAIARAAAAAKAQADAEAAAAAMNAPVATSPVALVGTASAADSAAAFSPCLSPAAGSSSPRNIGSLGALFEHAMMSPTPGLVTIMGRRLNSPVSEIEPETATAGMMPRLTQRDTLPLNEAELSEQATYEDMVFSPLQSEASSPPSADDSMRVLKRTATQEQRELDPSSTVSSSMPDRSGFILGGHLRRRDTDPYALFQLKQEGTETATEVV